MISSERRTPERLFFNLVSDTEMIHDDEGVDLPPEGDLVSHIARALEDLHQNDMLASAEWQGWQVGNTERSGQTPFSVALGCPSLEWTFPPLN